MIERLAALASGLQGYGQPSALDVLANELLEVARSERRLKALVVLGSRFG
jgi:hypothetical protein